MIKLSVPAKNFVLGEYSVLKKNKALLFTHGPRFTLLANESPTPQLIGIHPQSPAGQFYQAHFSFLSAYLLNFIDPYHGIGGVGASSAQFILLHALYHYLKKTSFTINKLLETYQKFTWKGEGQPPSGADVIAQFFGGFLVWVPTEQGVQNIKWPFSNELTCHFIHTRHKIKTHEHLHSLTLNSPLTHFKDTTEKALSAIKNKNATDFCAAINAYATLLQAENLTTQNTLDLLTSVKKLSIVKAAKGCGALGSDVIIVITEKNDLALHDWIKAHQLHYLSNQTEKASGLLIELIEKNPL